MLIRLLSLLALFALGCSQYRLEERASPRPVSGEVSLPKLIHGEEIDLRSSGCERTASRIFIIRLLIRADGSTDDLEFTKGEPTACIRSFIARVVAEWAFEPSTLNGEPVGVYYLRTVSYRD